jgi:hypothetical protein
MLIVHESNTKELVCVSDDLHEITTDLMDRLKGHYGDTAEFISYIDDNLTLNKFHAASSFESVDDGNGGLVLEIYHLIEVSVDKSQITADGTDTATITATVDDSTSTETIELYQGETLVDSKPAVNGVATFEITMTEPGTLTLTVKSTTKYGQADVTIEGV